MSAGSPVVAQVGFSPSEEPQSLSDPGTGEPEPMEVRGPVAKIDPETLELRARPRRVVRFRRGLLIASAAGLSVTIAAAAWFALQPVALSLSGGAADPGPVEGDSSPEVLAGLPDSYGSAEGVPQLGPPLPGDLGRPILEHQRSMATEDGGPEPTTGAPDAAAQAAIAERQRRLAEIEQARGAPVLMQISRSSAPGEGAAASGSSDSGETAGRPAGASIADDGVSTARLRAAASRWQLSAGTVIAASLITGLNSDIPGMVVAQVTEPAFDSASGRRVLVPQGARLLGRYDSRIAFGQRRALLVWERLVMPDGSSLALDNAPATDAAGYAGVADSVDFHTWRLLRGIGMSTLLGVGTELRFGGTDSGILEALRGSVQSNADRAGQKIVERNLDVSPTIKVRPGFPVKVLLHKDLVLPPWRGA